MASQRDREWTLLEKGRFDPSEHPGRIGLAEATRELMLAVATSTAVTDEEMGHLASQVRELTAHVVPTDRCVRFPLPSGPFEGPITGSGDPVFGKFNPIAAPVSMTVHADGTATAVLRPSPLVEGPGGALHGGYSALLVDAVMGTLLRAQGITAMTGTLSVRYLARTPLVDLIHISAWVESCDRRKLTVAAKVSVGGQPTVEATGLFITVDDRTR